MKYARDIELEKFLRQVLKEDIGLGDITTDKLIPKKTKSKAVILVKEDCVVCGLGVFTLILRLMDKNIRVRLLARDGDSVKKNRRIAEIRGSSRAILTSERVALNFLAHLSGISSLTRKYVKAVSPFKVKILDTRKTTPGLKALEKYAVRIGGGYNHRMGLDDMILVKDNHLKVLGYRFSVVGEIRKKTAERIEIEVNNLKDFNTALNLDPDIIMLDNMSIKDMGKAVRLRNSRKPNTENRIPKLEASGGISLKNVRLVASTGVDRISLGEITHSSPSTDISLEIL